MALCSPSLRTSFNKPASPWMMLMAVSRGSGVSRMRRDLAGSLSTPLRAGKERFVD